MERFELKYLVDQKAVVAIEQIVRQHGVRDTHDLEPEGYLVSSTYFDTPDLLCYYEKKDGVAFRKKYRFRTYGLEPEYGFFEIKYRHNQLVEKQRVRFTKSAWAFLFEKGDECDLAEPLQMMVLNVLYQRELRPTHLVQYRRRAYSVLEGESPLRITFDFEVSGSNTTNHQLQNLSRHQIFSGYAVLELKTRSNLPSWCINMLIDCGLVARPISKYVLTLEKLQEH